VSEHAIAKRLKLVLSGMKQRCSNPNSPGYRWYGGKGVSVCAEWLASAEEFVRWALASGYKPGLVIDRKESDGNYSPDNCKFITTAENSRKACAIRKANKSAPKVYARRKCRTLAVTFVDKYDGPDIFDQHQTPTWLVDYPSGYDPKTGKKFDSATQSKEAQA
jgi:hypothetical protein